MNQSHKKAKMIRIVAGVLFGLYLLAFLYVTLAMRAEQLDLPLLEYAELHTNLIPFRTICLYIDAWLLYSYSIWLPILNIGGNLILMIPMAFFLPCFCKVARKWFPNLGIMLLILLFIEGLQLITRRGAFDVDDLLLNMLGAIVGIALWKGKLGKTLMKKAFDNK